MERDKTSVSENEDGSFNSAKRGSYGFAAARTYDFFLIYISYSRASYFELHFIKTDSANNLFRV